jgi:hypothetical protein
MITRSLTQTKAGLEFKGTKTEDSVRPIFLPASAIKALKAHHLRQDVFRIHFGADYAYGDLIFCQPRWNARTAVRFLQLFRRYARDSK